MDINKLNVHNLIQTNPKTEKVFKVKRASANEDSAAVTGAGAPEAAGDSVSISIEGMIKKTTVEASQDITQVREGRVAELKDKIASGNYHVEPQDVARAIISGRDIYEVLK